MPRSCLNSYLVCGVRARSARISFSHSLTQRTSIVSLTRNNTIIRMLRKYLTRASRSNTGTSSRKIYCLVRTKSPSHDPKTRLCDVLRSRKCFTKDMESALRSGRLIVVRGDLTLPRFGLENFESIARDVSLVIHCGSFVNHIFNYSNLKAANVGGTMTAIELATYVISLEYFPSDVTNEQTQVQSCFHRIRLHNQCLTE